MATNLAISDSLIKAAQEIGKHKTKKEAVTIALEEYVQRMNQLKITRFFGKVNFDPSYDYKKMRGIK